MYTCFDVHVVHGIINDSLATDIYYTSCVLALRVWLFFFMVQVQRINVRYLFCDHYMYMSVMCCNWTPANHYSRI